VTVIGSDDLDRLARGTAAAKHAWMTTLNGPDFFETVARAVLAAAAPADSESSIQPPADHKTENLAAPPGPVLPDRHDTRGDRPMTTTREHWVALADHVSSDASSPAMTLGEDDNGDLRVVVAQPDGTWRGDLLNLRRPSHWLPYLRARRAGRLLWLERASDPRP
jgi:hypothetical protein